MNQAAIFWPMMAQLAIPLWVLILMGRRKAVVKRAGDVSPEAATNNKAWPESVVLTSNSIDNQFQFPVVFYALCLILFNVGAVTPSVLMLCWAFVAVRWFHAVVHVTINKVGLRFPSFLFSCLLLLALFVVTAFKLAGAAS